MKTNRLLSRIILGLSLGCALQTHARDNANAGEADSQPAKVMREHPRGHDPSENGVGSHLSPSPSSPAPSSSSGEPVHDRGHDPSENGNGSHLSPTPTPMPSPSWPEPRPDHDRPSHPYHPQPDPEPWPSHPYPSHPYHPEPSPYYPTPSYPEPTPYYPAPSYPEPTPAPYYPEPSYPEPAPYYPEPTPAPYYPEPSYPEPAPSYPEPTPAPVTPTPVPVNPPSGHNWQTRTISFSVARVVTNEKIDLMKLARLANFKDWQVVSIRAVVKGGSTAKAYLIADDQVIAKQDSLGQKINLTPKEQILMDGSIEKLELSIKGSATIVDTIEIEMGTYLMKL